jgi:AraC-like DNA-binding protein
MENMNEMENMKVTEKQKETKKRIIKSLTDSIDENNCIDIRKYRKQYKSDYSLISRYFGSVDEAVESVHAIKLTNYSKGGSLKDRLAYDMICSRLEHHKSLSDIAREYGVTRSAITFLFHTLETKISIKSMGKIDKNEE